MSVKPKYESDAEWRRDKSKRVNQAYFEAILWLTLIIIIQLLLSAIEIDIAPPVWLVYMFMASLFLLAIDQILYAAAIEGNGAIRRFQSRYKIYADWHYWELKPEDES